MFSEMHFDFQEASQSLPELLNPKAVIRAVVVQILEQHFATHGFETQTGVSLYDSFVEAVEKPLLEAVLSFTEGNETWASRLLGISRATLRQRCVDFHLVSFKKKKLEKGVELAEHLA